jgi:hypothetical protein
MDAVRAGQVWRLFTFLFIPSDMSLWMLVGLYFTWWVGSSLETNWGAFKLNAYYFTGIFCTIVAALVAGPQANTWLNVSLFLAFATVFPDVQILLMFILPIRVKWLAYSAAVGDWALRASILAALVNYALFFGGHWREALRTRNLGVRQKARREELRSEAPRHGNRVCAICGAEEATGADIRVCSCEKCGGQRRDLCLAHAKSH